MRALVIVFAILSAGAAFAETAPLKRLTLRQDVLGFEAVGRLEIGDKGYCTGVLIAPDLVLTAAHCLFDRRTGAAEDVGLIDFRAGLHDGTTIAESSVARAVTHPAYDPGHEGDISSIRHDVALLELAAPIPAATAAPFAVRRLRPGARAVSVVSFARGRDAAPSWQDGCEVIGRQQGLLAVDCDLSFGSSGAPVFDRTGGRPNIVAIISSGGMMGDRTVALGMDLPGPIADLQEALRTGRDVRVASGTPGVRARRIAPGTKSSGGARFVRP
ncbi:hypothetical protein DEA8626_03204 [Defluviimonas aquaemixtae]|uniref:Peptidase S1 domain-containing protein n=1 Tax=Albidovulum aquaemixtae TaxID=1542388 RepID=A0A2R8BL76_9RHOB|nr:trypsin-like peptidase domain-containing protein [Defluviimonas aquaemixtae]SPH24155.1 hypothetical protein DEA8626_03204 [Defluviimonas aquaemixtae]